MPAAARPRLTGWEGGVLGGKKKGDGRSGERNFLSSWWYNLG
jgi:hypothetical protein